MVGETPQESLPRDTADSHHYTTSHDHDPIIHPIMPFPMSAPAKAYPKEQRRTFKQKIRHLLQPSVRLRTSLYTLSFIILFLLFLALNAAHSTKVGINDAEIATKPSEGSPADTGEGKNVAQGKDAHLVEQEIQRSFEEPDYALLSGKQPHEIGCDIPLEGEGKGVLVFLGIFSSAERKDRRDL